MEGRKGHEVGHKIRGRNSDLVTSQRINLKLLNGQAPIGGPGMCMSESRWAQEAS